MARLKLIGTIGKGATAVDIYSDIDKLKRDLRRFNRQGIPRAMSSAINKAGNKTRTLAIRDIAKGHNLYPSFVRQHIRTDRSTARNLGYTLKARGNMIPLSKVKRFSGFSAQKALGVRINTGTGARVIAGAFVARMPSGHVGVFKRRDVGRQRKRSVSTTGNVVYPELPIRELKMPSVPHLLTNRKAADRYADYYDQQFRPLFAKQLQFEIDKAQR